MMKKLLTAGLLGVIATGANAATIVSENFESGYGVFTPTGDVFIGTGNSYISCCGTSGTPANMANHFVSFGSGDQPSGMISSPINLVAGTSYTLDFDYRALGPSQGESIYAVVNGSTYNLPAVTDNNMDAPYQHATINFLAAGSTTTLQFSSSGLNSVDGIVDNVVLMGAAVPEPSTWAMMLLGFGGIGIAMRRTAKRDSESSRVRLLDRFTELGMAR